MRKKDQEAIAKLYLEAYKKAGDEGYEHIAVTNAFSTWLLGERVGANIINKKTGEIIVPANTKITGNMLKAIATVYMESPDFIGMDDPKWDNKFTNILLQKVKNELENTEYPYKSYFYGSKTGVDNTEPEPPDEYGGF